MQEGAGNEIDRRILAFNRRIDAVFRACPNARRIAHIEGVGPKIATVVAAVGREFRNGRHWAAGRGLVPRQHSRGDRTHLTGITKRSGFNKAVVAVINKNARTILALLKRGDEYPKAA